MGIAKNKKFLFFGCFLFVAAILFLSPVSFGERIIPAIASAVDFPSWNDVTSWINPFYWLLIGIQTVLAWFIEGAIYILTQFIDARLITALLGPSSTMITEVWSAVRDVCNLGFILTFLFSAFATIFHIEKYHIKNLIVKLVLMALLINFSLPITRFVVDLGNVPMYYLANIVFGSSGTSNIGSQIASHSKVICVLVPYYNDCNGGTPQSPTDYWKDTNFAPIIASIIMLFLFLVTIGALALLFVIRTIALVLFLMFSPIGFVGIAVPVLNKYANEFWDNLIKYVMFGPIMIFILAVSIKIMAAANAATGATGASQLSGLSDIVVTVTKFAPPIVVLWMGMMVAQKSSVAGSGAIMGWATGLSKKLGKGLTVGSAKFIGHSADRAAAQYGQRMAESKHWYTRLAGRALRTASPTATKNAIKSIGDNLDKKAFTLASAGAEDMFQSIRDHGLNTFNPAAYYRGARNALWRGQGKEGWKRGYFSNIDKSSSLYATTEAEAQKIAKDVPSTKFDFVYKEFQNAMDTKDFRKVHGMLRVMAENNDLANELVLRHGEEFGGINEVNPTNVRKVLDHIYEQVGVNDAEQRAKHMMTLADIGTGKGNPILTNMVGFDDKKESFYVYGYDETTDKGRKGIEEQANGAVVKLMNLEPQKRAQTLHPDAFFNYTVNENGDRQFTGISSVGKAIFEKLKGDDLAQIDRTRGDLKSIITDYFNQMQNATDMVEVKDNNGKVVRTVERRVALNESFDNLSSNIGKQWAIAMKEMNNGAKKDDALRAGAAGDKSAQGGGPKIEVVEGYRTRPRS